MSRVPVLQPDGGENAGGGNGGTAGPNGGSGGQAGPNPCNAFHGGCSNLVECTNDNGEAVCGECPEGTTGDGIECNDIDECEEGLDDCDDDPAADCVNIDFSYACRCPPGTRDLETDGANCVSIDNPMGGSGGTGGTGGTGGSGPRDECALNIDDCDDDPVATCVDTLTSYACTCPEGYEDPDTGARNCEDIDECDRGLDACDTSPAAECENTEGSYTCDCPDGYTEAENGHDCEDFDECSVDNDCDDDPNACVDGDGEYTCECPDGYTGNGEGANGCINTNECLANTDNCDEDPEAECEDTEGGFTCTCPGGEAEDVLGDGSACVSPEDRVSLGAGHTCVIVQGGEVKCWGAGFNGQLGMGNLQSRGLLAGQTASTFTSTPLGGRAIQISAGCGYNCALLENGDVKCWGLNSYGQLGLGDTANRGDGPNEMGDNLAPVPLSMPATSITSGCEYTCALLANQEVVCWGANEWGQLGLDSTEEIGDQPGEVEALDGIPVGGPVKAIYGGFRFVCAQLTDDSLKCWGRNSFGQLGQNLGRDEHQGDQAGEMANLDPINLGTGRAVREVGAGYVHVCARLDNNTVKCWGGTGPYSGAVVYGGIGYGDIWHRGNDVTEGMEADMSSNEMGDQLPAVALVGTPVQLSSSYHTCATFADGSVKCWGLNMTGALGTGDTLSVGEAPGEMGASLEAVDLGSGVGDAIAAFTAQTDDSSRVHSCALTATGALKCWGSNSSGQLGLGSNTARGDNAGELGDALPVTIELW